MTAADIYKLRLINATLRGNSLVLSRIGHSRQINEERPGQIDLCHFEWKAETKARPVWLSITLKQAMNYVDSHIHQVPDDRGATHSEIIRKFDRKPNVK